MVEANASSADDAAHLRQLLERQPACLIRVGADGVLLAVNDAALNLLGAEELKQVLGTKLTDRIAPEHHDAFHGFAARVWNKHSGSLEIDMIDPSGTARMAPVAGLPSSICTSSWRTNLPRIAAEQTW